MEEYFITPAQMLKRGLKLGRVDSATQKTRNLIYNTTTFKSFYGIHQNHASSVWADLLDIVPLVDIDLKGFFMALYFLRCGGSEAVRASFFDMKDRIKMRSLVWYWVRKIAALKAKKIFFPEDWDTTFIVSVDGTHFKCQESTHDTLRLDPSWFSFKHHSAGHNVQIVLSIFSQQCVDVTISKAGVNDKANLIKSGLLDMMPEGTRAVVDGGYPGDTDKLSGYNQFDSDEMKKFKADVKSRQETWNARMKIFHMMKHCFEHPKEKFPDCCTAVCVLIQYTIEDTDPESANPMFDI